MAKLSFRGGSKAASILLLLILTSLGDESDHFVLCDLDRAFCGSDHEQEQIVVYDNVLTILFQSSLFNP